MCFRDLQQSGNLVVSIIFTSIGELYNRSCTQNAWHAIISKLVFYIRRMAAAAGRMVTTLLLHTEDHIARLSA